MEPPADDHQKAHPESEEPPDWLADYLPPKPYVVEKGNFRRLVIPGGRWNEEGREGI